jgi:hypothetical protein
VAVAPNRGPEPQHVTPPGQRTMAHRVATRTLPLWVMRRVAAHDVWC